MKVKLITVTSDPINVMWTAARTCYSATSPNTMWDTIYGPIEEEHEYSTEQVEEYTEKHWKLVKAVLDSGHQSVAEHVTFTFAIEGISRACSHQLVRHRAGIVFSQQSQRYVEIKENVNTIQNMIAFPASSKELAMTLLSKYFVDVNDNNYLIYLKCLQNYLSQTELGVKAEDARNVLPNATKTNITMTVNFRELIHLCHLRLCTRAQLEIRNLFKEIVKEVKNKDERLASYLIPQCEVHGFCHEKNCCGRKPTLTEVMDVYNKHKEFQKHITKIMQQQEENELALLADTISKDDMLQLQAAMLNPKFNQKLKKLMEEPNVLE